MLKNGDVVWAQRIKMKCTMYVDEDGNYEEKVRRVLAAAEWALACVNLLLRLHICSSCLGAAGVGPQGAVRHRFGARCATLHDALAPTPQLLVARSF